MAIDSAKEVQRHGLAAKGKKEYLKFIRGENLTMKQRVLANCYQCTGMYTDGKKDCEMEDNCTLHVFMPYRKGGVVKRKVSEETRAKLRERGFPKIKSVAMA